MPLLLAPLLLLFVLMTALLLMPLSLVLRYRRSTARRQARGWVATLNVVSLAISAALFLTTAAITHFWVPHALTYSAAGMAAGALLGLAGLWLSRWEVAPQSLHLTPNRWLVLLVMLVVTSRLLYGVWRAWYAWISRTPDTSWLAAAGVAGSMGAGAVVIGYYLTYWYGVRRRIRRHETTSSVIDVIATRVRS